MKVLSSDVKALLDKLYNLRGEDSVILAKMNKERQEAIETGERTKNEKEILLNKLEKLSNEEKTLQEEGEKLTSILSNINRDDFSNVLDRLQIDFDPASINDKISKMLPETIEKVVSENKLASEELESVETEMNNAITKVEELGIRKDEALSNQAKLNEYFDLALEGNINITRDAITSLLEKFDFNEDEQREAAKILMFPEDALYEYDASYKSGAQTSGKTITEVLMEAKKESKAETKENKKEEHIEINEDTPSLENIFESVMEKNDFSKETTEQTEEKTETPVEPDIKEEVKPLFSDSEEPKVVAPSKEERDNESNNNDVKTLLTKLGININSISEEKIKKVMENYDEELITKNIESLKAHNINLEILIDNTELVYDKELNEKIEKLISIGKESRDISLMPSVLVKYDLKGLNNTINVLQISGLDPKKVPLMAY
mgnify:CR=1 FL=1